MKTLMYIPPYFLVWLTLLMAFAILFAFAINGPVWW